MKTRKQRTTHFGSVMAAGIAVSLFLSLSAHGLGIFSVAWIRNATRNDVVNIGDSMFAFSGKIMSNLHAFSGETFRTYSKSGAVLDGSIDPFTPDIMAQYNIARRDDPGITTIIMDGGANDVMGPALLGDPYHCVTRSGNELSEDCKDFYDDLYVDSVDFMNRMGKDGVENIICVGYMHMKFGWINIFGTKINPAVDYGDGIMAKAVKNAAAFDNHRVFIDPRELLTSSDILLDGVHPTGSGSLKYANLIWPELEPLL